MEVVRTEVQALRAEYRETLLEATEARERIDFLTRQLERQERLKEKGMSRLEAYDEARHNLDVGALPAGDRRGAHQSRAREPGRRPAASRRTPPALHARRRPPTMRPPSTSRAPR